MGTRWGTVILLCIKPRTMSADAPEEGGPLLLNQPIVIDNGTNSLKAGFAGSSKPKVVLGTKVGRIKHPRVMPGGALETDQGPSSLFVGRKLEEHRGAFVLEYPMDKGAVTDQGWDAMEQLWEHIYSKPNLNSKQEEHPLLLTEAPLNSRANRDTMAQIMFESLRVPALYVAPPAVLSLYASGRTTGLVLDVGEGVTHAIPVYEGLALQHAIQRSDVAGRAVTQHLQRSLRKAGLALTTTAEADFLQTMKHDVCYLTGSSAETTETGPSAPYQLPDGQTITLTQAERTASPNVLFDPTLMGSEEPGAADVLMDAMRRSDMDIRAKLYSQMVLAGGSTLMPGFGDRLLTEVRARAPSHTRIRISAPPDRIHSAYVGGSILASLATFKSMWVSRADYEERGSSILHERD